MSLARRNNLIASTVFRRTVLSGLIGVMSVIGLVWIGYAIHRAQTLNEVSESLDREMEGLEGLYAEQGITGLVSALSYDGKSIDYGSAEDLLARIRTIERAIAGTTRPLPASPSRRSPPCCPRAPARAAPAGTLIGPCCPVTSNCASPPAKPYAVRPKAAATWKWA